MVGQLDETRGKSAELPEAGRLVAARDALLDQLARLEHLERDKPVERREGGLSEVVGDRLRARDAPRAAWWLTAATSFSRMSRWASIEVRPRLGRDRAVDADVVDALELLGDFSLEERARTLSRALDRVPGVSCPCATGRGPSCLPR